MDGGEVRGPREASTTHTDHIIHTFFQYNFNLNVRTSLIIFVYLFLPILVR